MTDFKPITTQEELDAIIKDRIKRDRRRTTKRFREVLLPILADLVDAVKSLTSEQE